MLLGVGGGQLKLWWSVRQGRGRMHSASSGVSSGRLTRSRQSSTEGRDEMQRYIMTGDLKHFKGANARLRTIQHSTLGDHELPPDEALSTRMVCRALAGARVYSDGNLRRKRN